MSKPEVALVFTGGTIESVGKDRMDLAWYIENGKRLSEAEVLARVPELDQVAPVREVPFRKLPSHALVDKDWIELVELIHKIEADGAAGVVIVHGTNTLEETAYFLHLTLKTEIPVVIVGSMRPASAISADGDLNLVKAVATAAAEESRGKGVLVVLNDNIYSARDVTKTSTYRVEAFDGRDLGPLGFADNDHRIVYYHEPVRPHTTATEFDVRGLESLPRVDVVTSYVGADGVPIDALVAAGAKGIVSAGTGAGRPTPAEDAALDRALEAGVAVCIGTRVGSGRSVRSPGTRKRGAVAADNLVPWKARLLLALGLTRTEDADELQRFFDVY